jgi:hypothetical protein
MILVSFDPREVGGRLFDTYTDHTNAQAVRNQSGLVMVMFHWKCIEDCKTNPQFAHIAAREISHLILRYAEKARGLTYEATEPLRLQHESEADKVGLIMMTRAGYDKKGSVEWLERAMRRDIYRHKKNPPKPIRPRHRTHPPVS